MNEREQKIYTECKVSEFNIRKASRVSVSKKSLMIAYGCTEISIAKRIFICKDRLESTGTHQEHCDT